MRGFSRLLPVAARHLPVTRWSGSGSFAPIAAVRPNAC